AHPARGVDATWCRLRRLAHPRARLEDEEAARSRPACDVRRALVAERPPHLVRERRSPLRDERERDERPRNHAALELLQQDERRLEREVVAALGFEACGCRHRPYLDDLAFAGAEECRLPSRGAIRRLDDRGTR